MVNLFGRRYSEEHVQTRFGNLPRSMLTLFQIMTTEGWAKIAQDMMDIQPWSLVIIILYMSLTTYAMVNVVVAVIVDSTLTQAQELQSDALKRAQKEEKLKLKRVA